LDSDKSYAFTQQYGEVLLTVGRAADVLLPGSEATNPETACRGLHRPPLLCANGTSDPLRHRFSIMDYNTPKRFCQENSQKKRGNPPTHARPRTAAGENQKKFTFMFIKFPFLL